MQNQSNSLITFDTGLKTAQIKPTNVLAAAIYSGVAGEKYGALVEDPGSQRPVWPYIPQPSDPLANVLIEETQLESTMDEHICN